MSEILNESEYHWMFSTRHDRLVTQNRNRWNVIQAWDELELTDPTQHTPDDFCYVVLSVMPEVDREMAALGHALANPGSPLQDNFRTFSPSYAGNYRLLCASVIGPGKTDMFARTGYLLGVQFRNVVATGNSDLGTQLSSPDKELEFYYQFHNRMQNFPVAPRTLVDATYPGVYNELVLTNFNNARIAVIGSVTTEPFERLYEDEQFVLNYSWKRDLPVIELM
ncbi:hypothetical protein KC909_06200 [Candidatus Dojkabacteria bacterium]|uniref:Uncharacterized protein n=1 Tax=Candidatus Dojkabacteria bacterium TaxID=2099670 RepID=A0A955RJX4_9BACT|nr:hypothetical protein [Candidatus Dojkabacteria bacterium]